MPEAPVLHRLHPAAVVLSTVRVIRGWVLPLAVSFIAGTQQGPTPTWFWIALGGAILTTLGSIAHDLSLRYGIVEDRLHIRSGILVRKHRQILLERIQTIDLRQGVLHRFLGVAEVRIETAGGQAQSEAHLAAVGIERAQRLQAELLRRRGEVSTHSEPPVRLVRRSSTNEIFMAGATTNRVGVIVAGLFGLLELTDFSENAIEPMVRSVENVAGSGPIMAVVLGLAGLLALAVAGWVVSIAMSVVRYHGFTLYWSGHDLRRSHGLLTRYQGSIPLHRLQVLRLDRTLMRRLFHVLSIQAATAGSAKDQEQGGDITLCPLLGEWEVAPFCRVVLPDLYLEAVRFTPVSPLSQRRNLVRFFVLGTAVALLFIGWQPQNLGIALLAWLPFAFLLARARFRVMGYAVDGPYLAAQAGILTRRTWIVPKAKIQTVALRRSPMQRRLGLASLEVTTAGGHSSGSVGIVDLEMERALELLERLAHDSARTASRREAV